MSAPLSAPEIDRAFAEGRKAWPGVAIDREAFARKLAALDVAAADLGERPGDLYLAIACAVGAKGAVAAFQRQFAPIIETALRRLQLDPSAMAEVTQRVSVRLFAGDKPRIGSYAGKGPLWAWTRVLAVRTALDSLAEQRPYASLSGPGLPAFVGAGGNPELSAMRAEHRSALEAALQEALAKLPARDKTILRLHLMDGLSLAGVAAVYRVNRSTALRWLASIKKEILKHLRRALGHELALSSSEVRSLTNLYSGELSLSLSRALAMPAASG